MGAKMARAGYDVTMHARGPHLKAMQEKGVRVVSADDDLVRAKLVADLKDAGTMDVVFLCVKAHGLPPLAAQLAPVISRTPRLSARRMEFRGGTFKVITVRWQAQGWSVSIREAWSHRRLNRDA